MPLEVVLRHLTCQHLKLPRAKTVDEQVVRTTSQTTTMPFATYSCSDHAFAL